VTSTTTSASAATGGSDGSVGVVVMNMGGPGSLDDVQPYIQRVLSDPRVVRLPMVGRGNGGRLAQWLFAALVSRRRAGSVRARYASIGGRSPLIDETRELAGRLSGELGAPVEVAMRYSAPSAADAVDALTRGARLRIVVGLSLYPQYSTATTESSLEDLREALPRGVRLVTVDRHSREPGFLDALAASACAGLGRAGAGAHLLFTAHSVPVAYTEAGDPYVAEVEETVAAVASRLPSSRAGGHSLAFQSAMRFGAWHGPNLDEELDRLVGAGVTQLVVQPVTFASENLETRYDLDIAFERAAAERGIERFIRQPTPGRSPRYVEGMAQQVRAALDREGASGALEGARTRAGRDVHA
jgi:protoporphyrin/coproporphyrin ferrochelatase